MAGEAFERLHLQGRDPKGPAARRGTSGASPAPERGGEHTPFADQETLP